ncbi:hypothetical protein C9374_010987 [Naegleria lovaniensis]|uniref:RGS domain-containing protein n=1 Tax=Naegleria lovaniensis TaxID=51637 RepID=A0AA88KCT4_NAELO|nr:uncharacterized protein C9374_010987 [Naegleria lovaniensis]KAG2374150.1 hypothetical protein C9374_010987 [Naegleria lovaniensis]
MWFDYSLFHQNHSIADAPPHPTALCHPLLFLLGSLSRDYPSNNPFNISIPPDSNFQVLMNTSTLIPHPIPHQPCPDTIFNAIIASVFVLLELILTISTLSLLIWKRHHPHIEKRNLGYLIMHTLTSFVVGFLGCLRLLIGRKLFPCAIHMWLSFMFIPALCLGPMVRCWRVFALYRMNLERKKLYQSRTTMTSLTTTTVAATETAIEDDTERDGTVQVHHDSTTNSNLFKESLTATTLPTGSHCNDNTGGEHSVGLTIHANSGAMEELKISTEWDSNKVTTQGGSMVVAMSPRSPGDMSNFSEVAFLSENTTDQRSNMLENCSNSTAVAVTTTHNLSYQNPQKQTNANMMESINDLTASNLATINTRKIRIYSCLTSTWFLYMIYGVAFFVQFLLWVFFGAIDEVFFVTSNFRYLTTDNAGSFDFTTGCVQQPNAAIILITLTTVFLILEFIAMILCFLSQRDTYHIKVETLIIITVQMTVMTMYVICGTWTFYKNFLDYFVSYAFLPMTNLICEVFVGVTLPGCYAIYEDHFFTDSKATRKRKQSMITNEPASIQGNEHDMERCMIEKILKNKKTFEMLLEFAKRSYCPESVLCYKDIEQFKSKMTSQKNRNKIGLFIVRTYCMPHSPAQLNLPSNFMTQVKLWLEKLEYNNGIVESTMFDSLQQHCLNDLIDVFERWRWSSKEVREMCRELAPPQRPVGK